MRILLTTEWFIRENGVSNVVYNLYNHLSVRHDVAVAAYEHKISEFDKPVKVFPIRYHKFKYLNILNLKRIIREFNPDIVHSHTCMGLTAKLTGLPYVSTYHGWGLFNEAFNSSNITNLLIKLSWSTPMYFLSMKFSDRVTTVSKYISNKLKKIGIHSTVIPNGIPKEYISKPRKNINHKRINLLFVGTISKRKGAHLLPVIAKILSRRGIKFNLDVVGRPIDNKIVRALRHTKSIILHSNVKDVKPYYKNADIFIFPSFYENFPVVILEAMAFGLPIITWDGPPFNEVVVNNKNGILVERYSINKFVDSIEKSLENEKYSLMSKNSISIAKGYTWEKIVKKYERIYKEII